MQVAREPTRRSGRLLERQESPLSVPTCSNTEQEEDPLLPTSQPLPHLPDLYNPPLHGNNSIEGGSHEESFFDTLDDPSIHYHGRMSNCEAYSSSDGEQNEMDVNVEGGGLEEILQWPEELLYQPFEKRRKKTVRRHRHEEGDREGGTMATTRGKGPRAWPIGGRAGPACPVRCPTRSTREPG